MHLNFMKSILKYTSPTPVHSEDDLAPLLAHLESITYSVELVYKLGLSPQQTVRALDILAHYNLESSKSSGDVPDISPQLQKLLDERI